MSFLVFPHLVFPLIPLIIRRGALIFALALAACTTAPSLGSFGADVSRNSIQYSLGRLNQTWTTAPTALVMIQRAQPGEGIQIIGLENATTLEGDNFLWLRAHGGRASGRFDLENTLQRVGGVPTPFRTLDNRNLRTGSDGLGDYFWQEWRSGAATNCVIALRRLESGARALPRGTRSLEVFLRNCVDGPIEQALAPILADQISLGAAAGSRVVSPLAAPRP